MERSHQNLGLAYESAKVMEDIRRLLGGSSVTCDGVSADGNAGCRRVDRTQNRLVVTVVAPHQNKLQVEACRFTRGSDFSDFEISLCDEVAQGATILWSKFAEKRRLHIKTAVNESALLVGISRFVRSKTRNFFGTGALISLMQQLTFLRYEAKPCTSGLICLQDNPDDLCLAFDARELKKAWHLSDFQQAFAVQQDFFANVGSYRYVDGAGRFYVVGLSGESDTPGIARGTIELTRTRRYSLADRAAYLHIAKLLPSGEAFVLCANRNGEVDLVPRKDDGHFLRWTKGAWRIINTQLMHGLIVDTGAKADVASALIRGALALSLLRYGTLVLIPDGRKQPPGGSIDHSSVGVALRAQLKGKSIGELVQRGQYINALS